MNIILNFVIQLHQHNKPTDKITDQNQTKIATNIKAKQIIIIFISLKPKLKPQIIYFMYLRSDYILFDVSLIPYLSVVHGLIGRRQRIK